VNLAEDAYDMPTGMLLHEAGRQFAMAEIVRDDWQQTLYERGGWFLLLVWAERVAPSQAPYCAKLAGPCPDGCPTVKLTGCGGGTAGDCWRVKQPPTVGVSEGSKP
jgi:hypothetical protein